MNNSLDNKCQKQFFFFRSNLLFIIWNKSNRIRIAVNFQKTLSLNVQFLWTVLMQLLKKTKDDLVPVSSRHLSYTYTSEILISLGAFLLAMLLGEPWQSLQSLATEDQPKQVKEKHSCMVSVQCCVLLFNETQLETRLCKREIKYCKLQLVLSSQWVVRNRQDIHLPHLIFSFPDIIKQIYVSSRLTCRRNSHNVKQLHCACRKQVVNNVNIISFIFHAFQGKYCLHQLLQNVQHKLFSVGWFHRLW